MRFGTGASMYCRRCKYPIREVFDHRCPECGQWFEPGDPSTYIAEPPPWSGQRFEPRPGMAWAVVLAIGAMTVILAPMIMRVLNTIWVP